MDRGGSQKALPLQAKLVATAILRGRRGYCPQFCGHWWLHQDPKVSSHPKVTQAALDILNRPQNQMVYVQWKGAGRDGKWLVSVGGKEEWVGEVIRAACVWVSVCVKVCETVNCVYVCVIIKQCKVDETLLQLHRSRGLLEHLVSAESRGKEAPWLKHSGRSPWSHSAKPGKHASK